MDDLSNYNNYRPTSLLSTVDQVSERIIHKHIYIFIANIFIPALQSGFVIRYSTENQFTDIYNTFCRAYDNIMKFSTIFLKSVR